MPNRSSNQKEKRKGSNRVRISASLRLGMDKELELIALAEGMNKSQVLQSILAKEIARRKKLKGTG